MPYFIIPKNVDRHSNWLKMPQNSNQPIRVPTAIFMNNEIYVSCCFGDMEMMIDSVSIK